MPIFLSKIFWLWSPMVSVLGIVGLEFLAPRGFVTGMYNENGAVELAQFFIVAAAFVVAVLCLGHLVRQGPSVRGESNFLLLVWCGIAALACLYIAGEEVSWGQHFLNWSTPEYWAAINDQGETNFHNTSSWLDQKPRLVLEIGIVIGGLIIPFLLRFLSGVLPQQFSVIYPPAALSVTAAIALFVNLADKVADHFGIYLFGRASEVEELYLFYFVLLYLVILRTRIVQNQC